MNQIFSNGIHADGVISGHSLHDDDTNRRILTGGGHSKFFLTSTIPTISGARRTPGGLISR